MDKGTRVKIIDGNGKGTTGTVFWTGPDRYNPQGLRLGISGDDGETYWASKDDVDVSDSQAPAAPTFDKGDRVRFRNRGQEGTGTVFWIGESRSGPGQRLGIRDDADPDEAVWLDARFAKPLPPDEDPGEGPAMHPQPTARPAQGPDLSPPDRGEEPPPIDDSYIDQMAAQVDTEPDDVPW